MEKLKKEKWTKQNYQEYINYLISLKEDSYKEFNSKLIRTKYEILGIRMPILRKIAEYISRGDITSFLNNNKSNYYEEVMIKGLVLTKIATKDELLKYLDDYVLQIDNWGICDTFCNSLKIVNNEKYFWFNYFANYLTSSNEFKVRVGLVIFLNFYVDDNYLNQIFSWIDKTQFDKYYVNMAIAWLLCECFTKYRDETLKYLKKSKINSFTFSKTISKINDSYRISEEDKKIVKEIGELRNEKN